MASLTYYDKPNKKVVTIDSSQATADQRNWANMYSDARAQQNASVAAKENNFWNADRTTFDVNAASYAQQGVGVGSSYYDSRSGMMKSVGPNASEYEKAKAIQWDKALKSAGGDPKKAASMISNQYRAPSVIGSDNTADRYSYFRGDISQEEYNRRAASRGAAPSKLIFSASDFDAAGNLTADGRAKRQGYVHDDPNKGHYYYNPTGFGIDDGTQLPSGTNMPNGGSGGVGGGGGGTGGGTGGGGTGGGGTGGGTGDGGTGGGTTDGGVVQHRTDTGGYVYNPAQYDAYLSTASQMVAEGLEVTPDMLVENRLANIMNSPVGRIAMDVASEYMNARGMMSSTAALQSITKAAIEAGFPIAQQDAQTYLTGAMETSDAINAAREANMNALNNTASLNQNAQNQSASWNAAQKNQAYQYNATRLYEDYWRGKELAEESRRFNETLSLDKLRTELLKAESEVNRGQIIMGWIGSVYGSGINKEAATKVFQTALAAGLLTPAQVTAATNSYTTPVDTDVT